MRLMQRKLSRHLVLASTAAMFATTVALVWGAGPSFAKSESTSATYYEDSNVNLCVGLPSPGGFSSPNCEWAAVTGYADVAVGDEALGSLSGGYMNTALGNRALASQAGGYANVAVGSEALEDSTNALGNTAIGLYALRDDTTGDFNVALGDSAFFGDTTGSYNIAIGAEASGTSTGNGNIALGWKALRDNSSGYDNVAIGSGEQPGGAAGGAGGNIEKENNIDISNAGEAADSGTTRIGTEGIQTEAFVAGIAHTALSGCTVQVLTSGVDEGQLGCNTAAGGSEGKEGPKGETGAPGPEGKEGPVGPAGDAGIATFAGKGKLGTGFCLNSTEYTKPGTGACPPSTTGYSASALLDGPIPANGGKISDLYANTSPTVAGSETVTVRVIDSTTATQLLSCVIIGSHCENASVGGSAAGGDNIEVEVTASPALNNDAAFRVEFRL